MSIKPKILITADVHLDSYPSRTPSKDYRLNQSYVVTDLILECARKKGADYLFILGDLLEKQNRDSPIHSVVKDCLSKLMTGFSGGGYYILGNHDMTAKSVVSESSENDMLSSYIHLYCPENLRYADRRVIEIGGVSFGFRNYSSADTLDLSFIKESGRSSIDVLCGHSSQSYTDGEPLYQVQSYDESLVKLYSFFGHIHQSVWKGNKVSVGVPQRAKITDDTPRVVIFDTATLTWEYVDLDPQHRLMDLQETTESETDYFDPDKNIYYIARKKATENKELLKAVSETGYDKIFEAEIKSRGLGEIFTVIKDHTPLESLERLDLDFQITGLRIENWRIIKNHSQTFKPGDQFLVSGSNGSGKSSIYSALSFGLSGKCPGQVKDNIRFGEKEAKVEVDLIYHGSTYTIKRGTSSSELWRDGIRLELGNKIQTKEGILRELPFLEAMDLMYYNENNQRILGNSSSSDTAKLQILYKILGLNEIDAYNSVATEIHKRLSKEFQKKHESFIIQESALQEKRGYLNSLEIRYGDATGFDASSRLADLRGKLQGYQDLYRKKQEYDRILMENQKALSEISGTELLLGTLRESLRGLGDIGILKGECESLRLEIESNQEILQGLLQNQSEYSRVYGSREFVMQEGQRLKKELETLEEEIHRPVMCSSYGIPCSLVTEDMKREKLKTRREDLERQRESRLKEYFDLTQTLDRLKSDPSEIRGVTDRVQRLSEEYSVVSGKVSEAARLENQIALKESYLKSLKSRALPGVSDIPELPADIVTRISDLSSEIATLEGYQRLLQEYTKASEEFTAVEEDHRVSQETLERYGEFISLTKPSGIIYTKIFEIIMTSFSDSKVRYEVNVTRRGENRYINISSYLKKKSGEVSYSGASQGERCMMDIHFLSNLKVKFGLLILDEFLGNLDQDNHDDALEKMKSLETNLLFVTSHKDNLIPFPSRIEVTTVNGNESKYVIG